MLVRDVFDVLTAAAERPAALPAAAGMVSEQTAAAIESAWLNAAAEEIDHPREVVEAALAHALRNPVEAACAARTCSSADGS